MQAVNPLGFAAFFVSLRRTRLAHLCEKNRSRRTFADCCRSLRHGIYPHASGGWNRKSNACFGGFGKYLPYAATRVSSLLINECACKQCRCHAAKHGQQVGRGTRFRRITPFSTGCYSSHDALGCGQFPLTRVQRASWHRFC